ncbi:hypothetical protein E4191_22545 (plasmid) [Paracoccus liaowanqingii]|uniref:Anti-sigma factor n=1 Tax=Paracoccus liaowanqingii TaxID=2560053 RepID=A0A4Y5STK1_9RHOB|nr:hypothetical protein [Paracoccus liaowanqingii]QDA36851.1 hypothetical protein E4191_22545 [Paracoccus liaowanqingii]
MKIDDVTLMALADDELNAVEALALEARLAADPEARLRLARFRTTRLRLEALQTALPTQGPADADLIARIRAASITVPEHGRMRAVSSAANANRALRAAVAAGVVAVTITVGWQLTPGSDTLTPLQQALTQLPAGEGLVLPDGTDLTVIGSFHTAAGAFCREVETVREERTRLSVMCRTTSNEQFDERFALDRTTAGGYQPASGDIDALEAWMSEVEASQPLSLEAEAEALRR